MKIFDTFFLSFSSNTSSFFPRPTPCAFCPQALNLVAGGTPALVIEDNVFGNVAGGSLWGALDIALPDFPEGAFRLLLKAHFDIFSTSKRIERAEME